MPRPGEQPIVIGPVWEQDTDVELSGAPTEALATELAMKCTICGGTGDAKAGGWSCERCHGAGYLLGASVRVPCAGCDATGDLYISTNLFPTRVRGGCPLCAGRGWTASLSLPIWASAFSLNSPRLILRWDNGKLTRVDGGNEAVSLEDKRRLLTALAQKEGT